MKTRFNKLTAWLITLAMLLTMLPSFTVTALAADNLTVEFEGADGNTIPVSLQDADGDRYDYINTFEELEAAIQNGGEYMLGADIQVSGLLSSIKTELKLHMNGKNITVVEDSGNLFFVSSGGALTILGDGVLSNNNNSTGSLIGLSSSGDCSVNIAGGTYDGPIAANAGTCEISGGQIGTLAFYGDACTITGGQIKMLGVFGDACTITGGQIDNLILDNDGACTITGGRIVALTLYKGNCTITGGTFGFDPTEWMDTNNYTATKNGDETWTVTCKHNTFGADGRCTLCGAIEGELDGHTGEATYTPTADGTQHIATWDCCGTTVTEDHTGGTATCEERAKCEYCGAPYGKLAGHLGVATYTPTADGAQHIATWDCCGTTVTEDHTGGTATCQEQAKCEHCGAPYGNTGHSFANGVCTVCGINVGYCGATTNEGGEQSVVWTLDEDGVLTVSGTGATADYDNISSYAPWYRNSSKITALVIGEGVTKIGNGTFQSITNLETVTFAEGSLLTTIDAFAFDRCAALKEITLPAGVTSVDYRAFNLCTALTDIHVAEGSSAYKSIDGVLYTADGTTLVRYPEGKTAESFTTPDGVTTIGQSAFSSNKNIKSITLSEDVTTIGSYAFQSCTALIEITLPDSVTTIGSYAFQSCTALTEITLPAGVTSVDYWTFDVCTALTDIHVAEGGSTYKSIDGVLYTADGKTLVYYPRGKTAESFTTPDGVTTIGQSAFSSNKNIKSITLSKGVTTIGSYAFQSCTALTEITLPASVTSIGQSAFNSCDDLTAVYAPCNWDEQSPLYDFGSVTVIVAEHAGGTATCTEKAVCTVCGGSYGEEPTGHSTTAEGDRPVATCKDKAYCSVCESEYGEFDKTNHDETVKFNTNGFCPNNCDAYESATGSGTEDAPYQISNAGQLFWFAEQVNSGNPSINGKLTADIDLESRAWTPITNFSGTFDGAGFEIRNFAMNITDKGDYGLFGFVKDATIKDFTISGEVESTLTAKPDDFKYGVIADAAGDTTIADVHSYVNFTITDKYFRNFVGGILGRSNNAGTNFAIERCSFSGKLNLGEAQVDCTGGIVAYVYADNTVKINNCLFDGEIISTYNSTMQVGGFLGYYRGSGLTVTNSLSIGSISVSNKTYMGALIGILRQHSSANQKVKNNYYRDGNQPFGNSTNNDDITDPSSTQTVAGSATVATEAQLESGEVAYLLGEAWGQRIGTDKYPVLGGDKVLFADDGYYNIVEFAIKSNGTDGAKATATVAIPTVGTYTLIFADYEETRLNKVDTVTFTVDKVGIIPVPSEIDITLDKGDKIMLWQDMITLVPLCEAYIVK